MQAIVEPAIIGNDDDINTYNRWKAMSFCSMAELGKVVGKTPSALSHQITRALLKIKKVAPERFKEHQRKSQYFIKHIPSQTFCACFITEEEATRFTASKPGNGKDYWIYSRNNFKKINHLDPDHLVIHSEHA